jgi:hypothetical protein|nr:MAG TPA: hypothetical protein [Caudoviricetes sp.]
MVEITLKNGSKVRVSKVQITGELVDSNGSDVGGFTNFIYGESELNAIAQQFSMQGLYDAIFPNVEESQAAGESEGE